MHCHWKDFTLRCDEEWNLFLNSSELGEFVFSAPELLIDSYLKKWSIVVLVAISERLQGNFVSEIVSVAAREHFQAEWVARGLFKEERWVKDCGWEKHSKDKRDHRFLCALVENLAHLRFSFARLNLLIDPTLSKCAFSFSIFQIHCFKFFVIINLRDFHTSG